MLARSRPLPRLGAALILLLFSVSASAALAGPRKVTVWHSYRGAEAKALQQVADAFNQSQEDSEIVLSAQPQDSYASKLTTAIPRDNGPDVFVFAHDRIGDWSETGLLQELSFDDRTKFLPQTKNAVIYNDKVWGLPLAFKSTVLFYNKRLVKEPPRSTDELFDTCSKLDLGRELYCLVYLYDDFYYHGAWHFGFGGRLWNDEGRLAVDEAPSLAAMAFARSLLDRSMVAEEPSGALVAELFNGGKAAFVINGPWFIGEINGGIDFGVVPLPIISEVNRPARPFLSVEAVMVSSRARDAASAEQAARFIASADSARIRAAVGRQAVAVAETWDEPAVAGDPILAMFRQQLPQTELMTQDPRGRLTWEPMQLSLRKLFRAGLPPKDAAVAGKRRFAAIDRTAPTPRSPTAYLVILGIIGLGGLVLLIRSLRPLRDPRMRASARRGWAWISPAVIGAAVLLFIPFAVGLGLSLFSHQHGEWTFVGLGNFSDILFSDHFEIMEPLSFYFATLVTVAWTAVNLVLHVSIGLGLAVLLSRKGLALRPIYRVLFVIPWAVPNYITALIWKAMFNKQRGLINGIIEAFGGDGVSWFSSFPTSFFANVCANAWLGFPFMMVVCLGALQSIPSDLYEAADVDGASSWQKFRHITVPLLKPALVPAMLIGTVWTFNQFNVVYLVSGGEPDNSTDILISEAYRWAFTRQEQYGYAAAYAALIFVVLLGWSVFAARAGRRIEASQA